MERGIAVLIPGSQVHTPFEKGRHERHIPVFDRIKQGFTWSVFDRIRDG